MWDGAIFWEKLTNCAIATVSQAHAFTDIPMNFSNIKCNDDNSVKESK